MLIFTSWSLEHHKLLLFALNHNTKYGLVHTCACLLLLNCRMLCEISCVAIEWRGWLLAYSWSQTGEKRGFVCDDFFPPMQLVPFCVCPTPLLLYLLPFSPQIIQGWLHRLARYPRLLMIPDSSPQLPVQIGGGEVFCSYWWPRHYPLANSASQRADSLSKTTSSQTQVILLSLYHMEICLSPKECASSRWPLTELSRVESARRNFAIIQCQIKHTIYKWSKFMHSANKNFWVSK